MNPDPQLAYRESVARLSSPVGAVILLYEQAIRDVAGAIAAINNQDIEERTRKIDHALLVFGQLQGCLDLERGGDVSRNLDRFYGMVRGRLLEAQFSGSARLLREQMDLLLSIRAAWVDVERAESNREATTTPAPTTGTTRPEGSSSNWRA